MSAYSEWCYRIQYSLRCIQRSSIEKACFFTCWFRPCQTGRLLLVSFYAFICCQFSRSVVFFEENVNVVIWLMNVLVLTFSSAPCLKIKCFYVDILNRIICSFQVSFTDVSLELRFVNIRAATSLGNTKCHLSVLH